MIINVIGLGYVGLPTAVVIASPQYIVTGTDLKVDLIHKLISGEQIIEDKTLQTLLEKKLNQYLFFDTSIHLADYHFIAVPTPFIKSSKKVDLTHLRMVLDELIKLDQPTLKIVIESTISPGTTELLSNEYSKTDKKIMFFHAPERILPGDTYNELINNDRVLGSNESEFINELKEIYQSFSMGEIYLTDIKTAELSKVVENSFRDVNIAFANEVAKVCNEINVNVFELIQIANKHPRVNILKPGPGVGGHCIPIDPWFLVGDYPHITQLINAARKTNDDMPDYIADRMVKIIQDIGLESSRVGVYGLTYKANVPDFRESPSYDVISSFEGKTGIPLFSFDPFLSNVGDIENDFNQFLINVDFLVILVAHRHLINNLDMISSKLVFDVVNIVNQGNVIKL